MPKSTKTSGAPSAAPSSHATPQAPPPKRPTKIAILLDLLGRPGGATLADMAAATGWQAHSVRGALSGQIKKTLGVTVVSDVTEAGRAYRLATSDAGA